MFLISMKTYTCLRLLLIGNALDYFTVNFLQPLFFIFIYHISYPFFWPFLRGFLSFFKGLFKGCLSLLTGISLRGKVGTYLCILGLFKGYLFMYEDSFCFEKIIRPLAFGNIFWFRSSLKVFQASLSNSFAGSLVVCLLVWRCCRRSSSAVWTWASIGLLQGGVLIEAYVLWL